FEAVIEPAVRAAPRLLRVPLGVAVLDLAQPGIFVDAHLARSEPRALEHVLQGLPRALVRRAVDERAVEEVAAERGAGGAGLGLSGLGERDRVIADVL